MAASSDVKLVDLVAEWIHFTLFGIILPTIKLKVCTCWGLMNPATKWLEVRGWQLAVRF